MNSKFTINSKILYNMMKIQAQIINYYKNYNKKQKIKINKQKC